MRWFMIGLFVVAGSLLDSPAAATLVRVESDDGGRVGELVTPDPGITPADRGDTRLAPAGWNGRWIGPLFADLRFPRELAADFGTPAALADPLAGLLAADSGAAAGGLGAGSIGSEPPPLTYFSGELEGSMPTFSGDLDGVIGGVQIDLDGNVPLAPTPAPTSLGLFATGLAVAWRWLRRTARVRL